MSAAVAVRGLEKSFGDLHVLRGVDLEVAPGTVLALLGSNGSGTCPTRAASRTSCSRASR